MATRAPRGVRSHLGRRLSVRDRRSGRGRHRGSSHHHHRRRQRRPHRGRAARRHQARHRRCPRSGHRRAVDAEGGPVRADVPHAHAPRSRRRSDPGPRRAHEGRQRGALGRQQEDPSRLHLPGPVHRPRHHVRPDVAAAAAERPRCADRLPHAALRPGLDVRLRPGGRPVPVREHRRVRRSEAADRAQHESRVRARRPAAQPGGSRADRIRGSSSRAHWAESA